MAAGLQVPRRDGEASTATAGPVSDAGAQSGDRRPRL